MPSRQNTHIFDGHFKLDTFGFPAESLERTVELGVDDFADLTLLHREPLLLKLHVELDSITFLQAIFLRILLIFQIHLRLDLMDLGQGETKTPQFTTGSHGPWTRRDKDSTIHNRISWTWDKARQRLHNSQQDLMDLGQGETKTPQFTTGSHGPGTR